MHTGKLKTFTNPISTLEFQLKLKTFTNPLADQLKHVQGHAIFFFFPKKVK